MSLRNTIESLGDQLGDTFAWSLYDRRIRQEAIEETASHPALRLCPLATAVSELPQETIDEVLAKEAHAELRAAVERERPYITGAPGRRRVQRRRAHRRRSHPDGARRSDHR